MTIEQKDKNIARGLTIISGGIVVYWLYQLIHWLIRWFSTVRIETSAIWSNFGGFCLENLSIILVVYVFICLQIAGVVEFRYRKNFTEAFFLGIIFTPIIMLIYMKLKKGKFPDDSKEV